MEPRPVKPASCASYAKRFAQQKEKKAKEFQSKKETVRQTNDHSAAPASQGDHPAYELGPGQGTSANQQYEPQFGRHVGGHPGYESHEGQQYRVPGYSGSYPPEQPNYYYSPQHKPTSGKIWTWRLIYCAK